MSINFVHDKNTWNQMEAIEKATGKHITRIDTTDIDVMEEVSTFHRFMLSLRLMGMSGMVCSK